MEIKKTQIRDFAEMLYTHDWFYMMSDDNRVYEKGKRQLKKIFDFIKEHDDESGVLRQMYDAIADKRLKHF